MSSYKDEHERFVSGHNGTSFSEIIFVTGIPCLSTFTRDALQQLFFKKGSINFKLKFLFDFIVIILPNILSITVLNDYIFLIFLALLLINVILWILHLSKLSVKKLNWNIEKEQLSTQTEFVSYYRSIIVICTAVGILAVDFPVYPRRLAKTETYGYGLMDTGVGYYIFANAIISPEARGRELKTSRLKYLFKAIKSSLPLLILGLARLISVKGLDYQEHVTEYGVHWNFFFTLAALKVISSTVNCFIPPSYTHILAILVVLLHQSLLSLLSGSQYILLGNDGKGGRGGGLINANREGIFSLPGCFAIYLSGVCMGKYIFKERKKLNEWVLAAFNTMLTAVVFGVLTYTSNAYIQPVSRRFANATYVFWMICTSLSMILQCLVGDIFLTAMKYNLAQKISEHKGKHIQQKASLHQCNKESVFKLPNVEATENSKISDKEKGFDKDITSFCLLHAVTFNMLLYFLLANLMTGLVNMTVSTIYTGPINAVLILSAYMISLSLIVSILYRKNISIKLW